jgi:hypothetical protein
MKNQVRLFWLGALAMFLSAGVALSAQQTAPQSSPDSTAPGSSAQQPAAPPTSDQPAPPPTDQAAPPASSQTAPTTQSPSAQTPSNQAPDQSTPNAGASSPGSAAQAGGAQAFSGMIVKQGDKYMLQDEASGQTYDIDHQDEVQKYVGKRVRVHGTLDASGKIIHLQ